MSDLAGSCDLTIKFPDAEELTTGANLDDQVDTIRVFGKAFPVGYYVSVVADHGSGLDASHGLGVIRTSAGDMRFFDPNAGEYLIQPEAVKPFCAAFLKVYDSFGTWKLGTTQAFEVRAKSADGGDGFDNLDDLLNYL
jgi:hypothetical protein